MTIELQDLNALLQAKFTQHTQESLEKNRLLKETDETLEREIIEQKRTEAVLREEERIKILNEIAGAAAHEINQPLQVIIALCDHLLSEMAPEASHQRMIQSICNAGKRIGKIVYQMRNIRQYSTKHYLEDINIVDFDASTVTKAKAH